MHNNIFIIPPAGQKFEFTLADDTSMVVSCHTTPEGKAFLRVEYRDPIGDINSITPHVYQHYVELHPCD